MKVLTLKVQPHRQPPQTLQCQIRPLYILSHLLTSASPRLTALSSKRVWAVLDQAVKSQWKLKQVCLSRAVQMLALLRTAWLLALVTQRLGMVMALGLDMARAQKLGHWMRTTKIEHYELDTIIS